MLEIIEKLEHMIQLNTTSTMTESQENYVAGIADALEIVKNSVADNLIVGNTYYVIMYRDGDFYLPYIEEMKLYKVSQGRVKSSYCFMSTKSPYQSLVLASKKGLVERVFYSRKQAEEALRR